MSSTRPPTSQGGAARTLRAGRCETAPPTALSVALSHQVTSVWDQAQGTGRPQVPVMLGSAQGNAMGLPPASRLPKAAPQVHYLLCSEAGEEPTRWRTQPLWGRGQSAPRAFPPSCPGVRLSPWGRAEREHPGWGEGATSST